MPVQHNGPVKYFWRTIVLSLAHRVSPTIRLRPFFAQGTPCVSSTIVRTSKVIIIIIIKEPFISTLNLHYIRVH